MKSVPNLKSGLQLISGAGILLLASAANALTTCSVASSGFSSGYVPANLTTNITPATFSVTCSRDNAAGPPTETVQYQVAVNNGINALGTQNRAALAGSFLNYNPAVDSACATPWKGTTAIPTPAAAITLAKNSSTTNTYTYYGCIPAGQTALPPQGTYTDTVTMSFSLSKAQGPSTFLGGSFPVNIIAPATCNISTPPSNLNFTYSAFSATAVLANTSFVLNCTQSLAYTMALDATFDVVAGLNYTLALNTTANTGGSSPLASIGTGSPQTFYINGILPAGQPGACGSTACTNSQARTLTITY